MEIIKTVEKNIWIVNLLLLFLVAYFLAGLINFHLGKNYVLSQAVTIKESPKTLVSSGFTYHPSADKIIEGTAFGTLPQALPGQDASAQAATSIDAELLGVIFFSTGSSLNQATIKNKQDNKMDVYKVGDEVTPGIKVQDIMERKIVLALGGGRSQELLFKFGEDLLPGQEEPGPGEYVDPYSRMSLRDKSRMLAEYRKGLVDDDIKQMSDTDYKIKKAAVDKSLGNLNDIVTQARMVPNNALDASGNRVGGFRVFAIKPGSIYQKLGLRDGDVIKAINGAPMDTVDGGMSVLQSMRFEKRFDIEIMRGNRPMNMNYEVIE
jgi:type II secretory pathway component PulC